MDMVREQGGKCLCCGEADIGWNSNTHIDHLPGTGVRYLPGNRFEHTGKFVLNNLLY